MTKICTICKKFKDLAEFSKDKRNKSGLDSRCSLCMKEKSYIYLTNNKTAVYERLKLRYENGYNKKYYEEYFKNNKHMLARKWTQISYRIKQLFKTRNIVSTLTKEEYFEYFAREDQQCFYCGELLCAPGLDRVDNEKGYSVDNCVVCCKVCNMMKFTNTIELFMKHINKIYNYQISKFNKKPSS